jgi:hypothetical protein
MEVIFLGSILLLEIEDNLGCGDKIDDETFISNDVENLKKIIPPNSIDIIGLLEYDSLINSKLYVYSIQKLPENITPQEFLIRKIVSVQAFTSAIWFHEDNNVDFELGFLFYKLNEFEAVCRNCLNTKPSMASGDYKTLKLTRDKLKDIRGFYREHIYFANSLISYQYPTQLLKGKTRTILAEYYVTMARLAIDVGIKVSNYCSALETLFSTSQAELAHQLSERLAFFIAGSYEEKLDIYKKTKYAYKMRSKVVHGATIENTEFNKLKELSIFCDSSLRKAMNKILSNPDLAKIFDGNQNGIESYMLDLIFGKIEKVSSKSESFPGKDL